MKKILLITFQLFAVVLFSCSTHASGIEQTEIKASEIIDLIDKGKHVTLSNKTILDNLDFSQVQNKTAINSGVVQAIVDVSVTFSNCIFIGKVTSNGKYNDANVQTVFRQNLVFNGCDFRDEVDFQSAIVQGVVSFNGSIFNEKTLFNSFYSWAKTTYFGAITAEKEFLMSDALFLGNVDFLKANFKNNAIFQDTRFDGSVLMGNTQFKAKADFSNAQLNSDLLFNYAVFDSVARFNRIKVLGGAMFIQTKFNQNVSFTNASFFSVVKFNETIAKSEFDLSGAVFILTPLFNKFEINQPGLFHAGSVISSTSLALPTFNK
jgi:hypothetical protein